MSATEAATILPFKGIDPEVERDPEWLNALWLANTREEVAAALALRDDARTAGESAGHEFRGNQWTGGRGGHGQTANAPIDVAKLLADHPKQPGEDSFAYQSRVIASLSPQQQSDVMFAIRERYAPVPFVAAGIDQWCAAHGLPSPPANIAETPVNLAEADAVARYFETAPDQSGDPAVQAAYADFKSQSAAMYDYMTKPVADGGMGVTVSFGDKVNPYPDAASQARDLAENHHITIETGLGGQHGATMSTQEYDRFRAVHDVFGHAGIGGGFDRHGEYEAWLVHSAMYSGAGRQAMSTEYHAVNSAAWTGMPGSPGTGKSLLLPDQLAEPPWARTSAALGTDPSVDELVKALGLDATFAQRFDHLPWHPEVLAKTAGVLGDGTRYSYIEYEVPARVAGESAGHDFRGNQHTGGIPGPTDAGMASNAALTTEMLGHNYVDTTERGWSAPEGWQDITMQQRQATKAEIVANSGAAIVRAIGTNPTVKAEYEAWARQQAVSEPKTPEEYGRVVSQRYVDAWKESAADSRPMALAMQMGVVDVFAAKSASFDQYVAGQQHTDSRATLGAAAPVAQSIYEQQGATIRSFLGAEYERTQAYLSANGVKELTVYRGDARDEALSGQTHIELNPASSWSLDPATAQRFAAMNAPMLPSGETGKLVSLAGEPQPYRFTMTVPARAIISTAVTGRGALIEGEIIVHNAPNLVAAVDNPFAPAPAVAAATSARVYVDDEANADWIKALGPDIAADPSAPDARTAGESAGHDFRGNQWTGGKGGGDVLPSVTTIDLGAAMADELARRDGNAPALQAASDRIAASLRDASQQSSISTDAAVKVAFDPRSDPTLINEVADRIDRFATDHPFAAGKITSVGTFDSLTDPHGATAYAYIRNNGDGTFALALNDFYYAFPAAFTMALEHDASTSWHPLGTTQSVIDHELGHILDQGVGHTHMDLAQETRNEVSRYSSEGSGNSYSEAFAEVYATMLGDPAKYATLPVSARAEVETTIAIEGAPWRRAPVAAALDDGPGEEHYLSEENYVSPEAQALVLALLTKKTVAAGVLDDGTTYRYEEFSVPRTAGDVVNHDFHGNQWTGGKGGEYVVSMKDALADPKQFVGKTVTVTGPHRTSFDEKAVERTITIDVYQSTRLGEGQTPGMNGVGIRFSGTEHGGPQDVEVVQSISGTNPVRVVGEFQMPTAALQAGDTPGHDFHGNQWTGGKGGGDTTPSDRPTFADTATTPVAAFASAVEGYNAAHGLPAPEQRDWAKVTADPALGAHIAADYAALPKMDEAALPAYQALADEVHQQYDYLTNTLGIKVEVVATDPYRTVEELAHDISANGVLKVLSTETTGSHPFFTNTQNDEFRAVHDAFGHAAIGRGFDRNGEEAAYEAHAQMFSAKALPALATETRGQNSAMIYGGSGTFVPQDVALLPASDWEIAKAAALAAMLAAAAPNPDDDNMYSITHCHHTSLGRTLGAARTAGESAGHDFRGNQWTGGKGGGEGTATKDPAMIEGAPPEVLQKMLSAVPMDVLDPTNSENWDAGQAKIDAWEQANDGPASQYIELTSKWSSPLSGSGAEPIRSAAMTGSTEEGRQLAALLDAAPVIESPLFRGTGSSTIAELGDTTWAMPGDKFTLGPSSFSSDPNAYIIMNSAFGVAASGPSSAGGARGTPIVIEVESGARGLPVGTLSQFTQESEVISAGTFQVVSSDMRARPPSNIDKGGEMYQHIVVKQVSA